MRSYREFWLWLGAALLTVAAAFIGVSLAYFTKLAHYSPYTNRDTLIALIAFLAAFACFGCAIFGLAFPPWARIRFPNVLAEFHGSGEFSTTQSGLSGGDVPLKIVMFRVRITNLEHEQSVSLTIDAFCKLVPGTAGRLAEAWLNAVVWPLDPALALKPIAMPIQLAPGTAVGGDLAYELLPEWSAAKLADTESIRLSLQDHISGQTMEIPMIDVFGRYRREDMTPSVVGARYLDPAREPEPPSAPPTS